jgi:cell division protein FtsL
VSAPARKLEQGGATRARPKVDSPPQRKPSAGRDKTPRKLHLRFWIFAAATVSVLTISLVAISALRVQTDYAIRTAQADAVNAQTAHATLVNDVARLSAPARVAAWARAQGLVVPADAIILPIPGPGAGTPPGSSQQTPGGSGG